ncbi:MAG: DNA methyltransferase [Rhodothermaceae bacterium]
MQELLTIKEASKWASNYLQKQITPSNISYLIQYGRVSKIGDNGNTQVSKEELLKYYEQNNSTKEERWKDKLGQDLNWTLSFSEYKESETTKHVHRLHPYKGKFIPQLVEYFLDSHTDKFKKEIFFKKGDIILDPFCGSGTTLVQANELGIDAIGIDISAFNAHISNSKVGKYDLQLIHDTAKDISLKLEEYLKSRNNIQFESELLEELKIFNAKNFPSPDFKYKVRRKEINEKEYGKEREKEFLPIYQKLINKYKIELKQDKSESFLDKWFTKVIRDEIDFVFNEIKRIKDKPTKRILSIVLSRTIRSCRATTHSDLATLLEPQITTYYCKKHGKICKPLFSIDTWWNRYSKDSIKRINEFNKLKTNTNQFCLTGDSQNLDIVSSLKEKMSDFSKKVKDQKISGIFSSPPYVGLIDYHEQHAYSYDLFGFERKDELEIGPLYKGQGKEARESYVRGIANVLINSKRFLKEDCDVFLVANDKYGLYPQIAEMAKMRIVNQYKRPVLNRVEKDRNAYSEIIFHLKNI